MGDVTTLDLGRVLDEHRAGLTAYCYRMLASPFDAEDAVQETLLRAWRAHGSFDGRSSLKTWLHRIATNVCIDMLRSRSHRTRPMDLGPAREPIEANLNVPAEITWIEPIPDTLVAPDPSPAEVAESRESVKLALIAALQRLPAKQRAALILCEVMHWKAAEAAELLETSVASVNSALQRARDTLRVNETAADREPALDADRARLLTRYVDAFERYDLDALARIIRRDARQSMPPFDMWLAGFDDMMKWWFGPGIGCRGSRLIPVGIANGSPAYGQYKPDPNGGLAPWSLQVVELARDGVAEITFFLDAARLFPLFGLPPHLDG